MKLDVGSVSKLDKKSFALILLIIVLSLFLFIKVAKATTSPEQISKFASIFAMHPTDAVCYLPEDEGSPDKKGAWGYVSIRDLNTIHLSQVICDGALAVANHDNSVPDWQKAIGVSVIIHESYHARGFWDEARVECRAIRHFKTGVQLLGGTKEEADRLYFLAYGFHFAEGAIVDWTTGERPYDSASWCKVPSPWPDEN